MAAQAGKILVVDDDQLNRVLLTNQLELEGYLVGTAEVPLAAGQPTLEMLPLVQG